MWMLRKKSLLYKSPLSFTHAVEMTARWGGWWGRICWPPVVSKRFPIISKRSELETESLSGFDREHGLRFPVFQYFQFYQEYGGDQIEFRFISNLMGEVTKIGKLENWKSSSFISVVSTHMLGFQSAFPIFLVEMLMFRLGRWSFQSTDPESR